MNPSPALKVLQRTFGYPAFRGPQADIVEHLVDGGDALVLMPTGGGKSLCYQIPALLREGCGIVVSPLIALMQDQVAALRQAGVAAAALNSSLEAGEARETEQALLRGELDLLYVAPERLLTPRFLELLDRARVALFAIDEAHCVSQWGHDFRPEYRELDLLHQRWPQVPRIALTATADAPTRREIVERLGLDSARQFVSSFDRPNILYRIVEKGDACRQLLEFLDRHRGESGIIYCLSRRKVDDTAAMLATEGWNALPYHAGLSNTERQHNQTRFLREDGVVMVATIAFGMGIDKPDVRFVAHMDLPRSVESYYQETGRAGRDGQPAEAWMCYGLGEVVTLMQMIDGSESGEERKRVERNKLNQLLGLVEATRCRRQLLLGYFGEALPQPCGHCDNCLDPPDTWDGTEAAQLALSAIYRTGQRFGVGYLVQVLQGKPVERIVSLGHDRLALYGRGADIDAREWNSIFRQLVALGLVEVDVEGYGTLRLSEAARPVLRGEQRLALRRDRGRPGRRRKARGEAHAVDADDPLLAALRSWRRETARSQGIPAYVIFHDATLGGIAARAPSTLQELAEVSGVGQSKLERYGEQILEIVAGSRD